MKNGKLVREQEIKIDTELTNPNISSQVKPAIPKAEVQAKIVTEQTQQLVQPSQQQPQPVVSNNPEVEKQRLMQQQIEMLQKQLAEQQQAQALRQQNVYEEEVPVQKPALEPDYDEDAVNEILQQAHVSTQAQQQNQMQQQYIQQQQQFLNQQMQEEEMMQQQHQQQNLNGVDIKATLKFHFILRSGVDRVFEVSEDEFEKYYNYIHDSLVTKPVIILENVIMPVMAIDMVYYQ